MNLDIELQEDGEWKQFELFFRHLQHPQRLKRDIALGFRDFLRSYRWWAIKGLVTSGAAIGQSWPANVRGYTLGIRSGHYRRAIEGMKIGTSGSTAYMKFSEGDLQRKSHPTGTTLSQYMDYFEYGTSKQPARPLWTGAFKKAGGAKRLNRNALTAMKKSFNRKGLYNIRIKGI